MSLETGDYIDDLVVTNPTASDPKSEGDDQIRLLKKVVKQSFQAITGPVTATQAELNLMDGVTATTAELNILDGVTATTAELNILDGVTATAAELNFTSGATKTLIPTVTRTSGVAVDWDAARYTPTSGKIPTWDGMPQTDVRLFGAVQGASTAEMYDAMVLAWAFIQTGGTVFFPNGTYDVGDHNFPFRQIPVSEGGPTQTGLLDCLNGGIVAESPAVILKTTSVGGADVLQLYGLKNFHVKGYPTLTATLTGSAGAGSNGCSIVSGFDGITLELSVLDLPRVDKTTYVDGSKALTLQTPGVGQTFECGSLTADVRAVGCAEGFGYEPDLVAALTKKTAIKVNLYAEDCYYAVKLAAGAASAALSAEMTNGVVVKGQAVNCQKDVSLGRIHGVEVDIQVITTKTIAARRLAPDASPWIASDTEVSACVVQYAKNSQINVTGDKGDCDYKAKIGGASAGSSGVGGASEGCDIYLDIGGTAATADLDGIDSGGNSLRLSNLTISNRTSDTFPDIFKPISLGNRLVRLGDFNAGSFTATLTGVSDATPPTATIEYSEHEDVVVMEIPALTGTSNSNFTVVTGVPTGLRPTARQRCIGMTTDNSINAISPIDIETDGTITLGYGSAFSGGPFTASGTKGLSPCTISYRRS